MQINFNNVSFKYNDTFILQEVNMNFSDSKKTAILGLNGSGKSTILKLINEDEFPQNGQILKTGNLKISYLHQDPTFPLNVKIKDLFNSVEFNEFEIKGVLNKFKLFDHDVVVNNLSGGEKKRLALAMVILKKCDILILDEPTNHLDTEMILFLENYLIKWKKGLILITHDRYFLERVCNEIVEVNNSKIYTYRTNYSEFLELKKINDETLIKEKDKIKSFLKKEKDWINRQPQARSTKSKSRIERYEKLNNIKFNEEQEFDFSSTKTRIGKKTIEIINGSKSYDKTLFENFNFSLLKNDIIGFVGDNGCGKSTLFKIILGIEKLDSGELIKGETLKIGYFSQSLDSIDNELSLLEFLKDTDDSIQTINGAIEFKQILENFYFPSSIHNFKIKYLSGGEKRRLQLVKVLLTNPNLLILDEPTNDLDIYTLNVLEKYLVNFSGPILLVSHDRYFVDSICNRLLVFKDQKITEYNMTYSEYLENKEISKVAKPENKGVKNVSLKMTSKQRNELEELEVLLPILESKIVECKKELNSLSYEYTRIMELTNEINNLTNQYDSKMEIYFELLELKEQVTVK